MQTNPPNLSYKNCQLKPPFNSTKAYWSKIHLTLTRALLLNLTPQRLIAARFISLFSLKFPLSTLPSILKFYLYSKRTTEINLIIHPKKKKITKGKENHVYNALQHNYFWFAGTALNKCIRKTNDNIPWQQSSFVHVRPLYHPTTSKVRIIPQDLFKKISLICHPKKKQLQEFINCFQKSKHRKNFTYITH